MENHTHTAYTPVRKVLWQVLWLNLIVAFAKVGYGLWMHSVSLTADGYHSFFDGMSNIIGLVGLWVAAHPPDRNHPYGHRKFETLATIGIGLMLTLACLNILQEAYARLNHPVVPAVTPVAYGVVVATLLINWVVFRYEHAKGNELASAILHADAQHTRSDLLVTISVIITLVSAQFGIWIVDPIVAILIAGLIGKAAYDILLESAMVLSDASIIDPKEVDQLLSQVSGIRHCHEIRTRGTQNHILMDLRIHVDPQMTVHRAHEISDDVEGLIKKRFPAVQEVVVHVEPHGTHACPAP